MAVSQQDDACICSAGMPSTRHNWQHYSSGESFDFDCPAPSPNRLIDGRGFSLQVDSFQSIGPCHSGQSCFYIIRSWLLVEVRIYTYCTVRCEYQIKSRLSTTVSINPDFSSGSVAVRLNVQRFHIVLCITKQHTIYASSRLSKAVV